MPNQNKFLFRTNYFKREWTWIRRALVMIILGTGILVLPFEFLMVKFIGIGLVAFFLIAKPKDDLAVTNMVLLHIKRSAINAFTRIDTYDISQLTSIRCGGIHTDGWELIDFIGGGGNNGGYYNTVEMTFKNGESKSLHLKIDRKKLDTIVKIIYNIKRRI
jgi:hypothetical protein